MQWAILQRLSRKQPSFNVSQRKEILRYRNYRIKLRDQWAWISYTISTLSNLHLNQLNAEIVKSIQFKATNGQAIQKSLPEQEFAGLVHRGSEQVLSRLQQENDTLKDCMLLMQGELKQAIDGQMEQLARTLQTSPQVMAELGQRYGMSQLATQVGLSVPQSAQSMQQMCKTFMENTRKVKTYFATVLSPATVGQLVQELNTWALDTIKAKGQAVATAPLILSMGDLRKFIKTNKCTCEFMQSQRQSHFSNGGAQQLPQSSIIAAPERKQGGGNSLYRKKWGGGVPSTEAQPPMMMNITDQRSNSSQ